MAKLYVDYTGGPDSEAMILVPGVVMPILVALVWLTDNGKAWTDGKVTFLSLQSALNYYQAQEEDV